MKHFLTINDLTKKEVLDLIEKGIEIKKNLKKYSKVLEGKTLLMIFEKPSVRTRLSFETGMTQFGGHGIYYHTGESTLGKKETLADIAKVTSRYADIIMCRLFKHSSMLEFAKNSSVPLINGLDDFLHPCQVLGDLMTVREKFGKLTKLKIAYVGDANNNVTHSFMYACNKLGLDLVIGCPNKKEFLPQKEVLNETKTKIVHKAEEAVKDAHVIYTDTWMSYNIDKKKKKARAKDLRPFQVNSKLISKANKNAIFMHCLPAQRNDEVTDEVMDGKQSAIIDEAENRLHIQKAIILWLLGK